MRKRRALAGRLARRQSLRSSSLPRSPAPPRLRRRTRTTCQTSSSASTTPASPQVLACTSAGPLGSCVSRMATSSHRCKKLCLNALAATSSRQPSTATPIVFNPSPHCQRLHPQRGTLRSNPAPRRGVDVGTEPLPTLSTLLIPPLPSLRPPLCRTPRLAVHPRQRGENVLTLFRKPGCAWASRLLTPSTCSQPAVTAPSRCNPLLPVLGALCEPHATGLGS